MVHSVNIDCSIKFRLGLLGLILTAFLFLGIDVYPQMLKKEDLRNYSYIVNGADETGFQSVGSSSIVAYKGKFYLVSNYHVLTGIDVNTGKVFAHLRKPNLSITLIFRPKAQSAPAVVWVFPLFDPAGKENFKEFRFQGHIIDIAVMPIEIPGHASLFAHDFKLIKNSKEYAQATEVIIAGFPGGQFVNNWEPTLLQAKTIWNFERSPTIFDPFVFLDTAPIPGMSGAPVYEIDGLGNHQFIAVTSNIVDPDLRNLAIKGRSVNIRYGLQLIENLDVSKVNPVKGRAYVPGKK